LELRGGECALLHVHEHRYANGPWVRLHAFAAPVKRTIAPRPDLAWVEMAELATLPLLEGSRPLAAMLARKSP
jgi:hypothetical protein